MFTFEFKTINELEKKRDVQTERTLVPLTFL